MAGKKGFLLVLSGPSGCGKTTLRDAVLKLREDIKPCITTTTRTMRPGEVHGVDYYFVDNSEFDRMVAADEFLEWARVHGNRYGSSKSVVTSSIDAGRSVVLVLDVQGGENVKKQFGNEAVLVFIDAPDRQELERRLRARSTDSEDTIALRLANAIGEQERVLFYDYRLINDNLDQAVADLAAIVRAEEMKVSRILSLVD
ncbi:MAG: guanylate kinase [Candidatus Wallbacteria bacterium HGW-Wallbacteria-1]|jgi:guanylate kinase|uniref:Guanylate kinase n=1 Tax=Candidatus Wallbacteria bacterium HGW-Wallbacteria-1 TaxID=2013854 RepID=A0A2N1PR63_9BACT|nr:MAG: guanylate kinase [Candidatus Wallbacteria bacterium HGW-Wallbacteria-1]